MAAFSPTDVAFEGFRITRERPITVAIWTGFYLVVSLAMAIVMIMTVGPEFNALQQAAQHSRDLQQALAIHQKLSPFYAVAFPVGICVMSIFAGAVFRIVLGRPGGVAGHLAFGEDEFRLVALSLIVSALMLAALFVIVIVVGLIAAIGTIINPAVGGLWSFIGGVATFGVMLWVSVRLSLCGPMTFVERKIVVFRAWSLSRGQFWRLFGSYVLAFFMGLVVLVMAFVVFVPLAGLMVTATGGTMADVSAIFRPDTSSIRSFFTPAMILYQVFGAVITAVYYAVILAPQAMAYVALTDYAGDTEG